MMIEARQAISEIFDEVEIRQNWLYIIRHSHSNLLISAANQVIYSSMSKLVKRMIKKQQKQLDWLRQLWKRDPTKNVYEIQQLWFVQISAPSKARDLLYEIIEFESGSSLQFQRRAKYQGQCRFGFERSRDDPRLVYIKIIDKDRPQMERRYLMVEKIARQGPPPVEQLQITEGIHKENQEEPFSFSLQQIEQIDTDLRWTCIIVQAEKGLVLDFPEENQSANSSVMLLPKTRKLSQRWMFMPQPYQKHGRMLYSIFNCLDGKCLDVQGQKKRNNSRVIKYDWQRGWHQLWYLQNVGNGCFIIRSSLEQSLMLGTFESKREKGSQLAVVQQKFLWRIDGYFPREAP